MKENNISGKIKYVILIMAVAFIVYGMLTGQMLDVLKKAAAICLECCGIG